MEKYAQYAVKNILQIRKSQLDVKLDRNLRNAASIHQVADVEMFNNEEKNDDDREKEGEEEPEDNIDIPTADSYSHTVAIIHIHWREQDTIECLESSVLSHAHHALCMADNARMSNQDIGYNLNLLDTDSENGRKLGASIGISIATTDMWKSIHKTALTGEQTEIDSEPDNHPDIHLSYATTGLPGELVPEVMADLTSKPTNPRTLDTLPLNSDSRAVCDHIYLLLLLNQL